MKDRMELLDMELELFDGGEAAGGSDTETSAQGGTQAASAATRQGETGDPAEVMEPSDAAATGGQDSGSDAGSEPKKESPKERQARYRALVSGEFKDLFTADTQRIIDQRFKETRSLRETVEAQRPVLERLMSRYGVQDGDVRALAAALEDEERERQAFLAAQAQRAEGWRQEAEETRTVYPEFDLARESEEPYFAAMLQTGIPVKLAYEVMHLEAIKTQVARQAAEEREWALTEHIRARGIRPAENGGAAQNGLTAKVNMERMTKEERADVARRAMRGETIIF